MKATGRARSAPAGVSKTTSAGILRSQQFLAALALCALTFLAYLNSFPTGFALDNAVFLKQRQIYDATSQNVALIWQHTYWWPTGESGLYRPLTTLSFLFNYAILGNGDHPAGYHGINLILHEANVLLAFAVALRLLRKFWPAVFIAGVWGVHPLLTESVTNIVGRADLLAGISVLGGFLLYLKATESKGWQRAAWLGGLFLTTAVGAFSKESAVTVIGVIFLYELTWWKERGRVRDLVEGSIAVLLPVVALLYQRSIVLAASPPAVFPFVDNPITGAGFWTGRLTALKVMAHYLALLLWPARLSSDYSYPQIPLVTGSIGDWAAVLVVCAIGTVLLLSYRWKREMFFFGLFAFGAFLPTANLLFPIGTVMAERLMYLPAYGLIACLVLTIYWIGERTRIRLFAPVILVLAILGCAARTVERNPDWQNNLTLAKSEVSAAPRSFKAHLMLARALYEADPGHADLNRTTEEGERSVALLDPLPDSRNTWLVYRELAGYYLVKGDSLGEDKRDKRVWQRATQLLTRAISILDVSSPATPNEGGIAIPLDSAEAWRTLSAAWLHVPDAKKAYDAAVRARDLNPASSDGYRSVSNALRAAGRDDDAVAALMEGEMLTGDQSLAPEVVRIYQVRGDSACTLTQGPSGPEPNPACPSVRRQICAAIADAMQVQIHLHRNAEASLMKERATERYGCTIQ